MGFIPGRRERKKQESKKAIMESAVRNFKEKGVAETSIADIMKDAGLGVGTFYNYFESKETMLFCLLSNLADEVRDAAEKAMKEELKAQDILHSAMQRTTDALEKNPYVLPLFLGAAGTPQRIRHHLDARPDRTPGFKSVFTESIGYGQRRGEVDTSVEPDMVTEMFHSIFQAASFSKLSYSFSENVERKVNLILNGIMPR